MIKPGDLIDVAGIVKIVFPADVDGRRTVIVNVKGALVATIVPRAINTGPSAKTQREMRQIAYRKERAMIAVIVPEIEKVWRWGYGDGDGYESSHHRVAQLASAFEAHARTIVVRVRSALREET